MFQRQNVMDLGGLGIPSLALAHLTEGMVEQVALTDLWPAVMIARTTTLWSLVTIIVRADLLGVRVTISVVG